MYKRALNFHRDFRRQNKIKPRNNYYSGKTKESITIREKTRSLSRIKQRIRHSCRLSNKILYYIDI